MDLNRKKDSILPDFVRFSWKASRGLIDKPDHHVSYWSDRLERTGKLTPEQVSQLSQFIATRTTQAHQRFLQTIDQSIVETVAQIGDLTEQELKKIDDKLTSLSTRLDQLK